MTLPAEQLGVPRETYAKLELFVTLLTRWQNVKNLVGPATLPDVWTRHIADSVQLAACAPKSRRWLDLGSGAGFPGLVIAIVEGGRPDFRVDLVESNARKCAFLREAARQTAAPVHVHHARLEEILSTLPPVDTVCARALAPLDRLLEWTAPLLTSGTIGLFPKGRDVEMELTLARRRWRLGVDLIPSCTDPEARIVRVSTLAPLRA